MDWTYEKAIEYIDSLMVYGSRPGLERIVKLLSMMGNPQQNLKVIHIAGTNGKGSTAAICASILKKSGYKTGLYISPYVINFTERMQINSEMISKSDVAKYAQMVSKFAEEMREQGVVITEFEFITALAFKWFSDNGCDIICLEVGLGGRFDATNAVSAPLVSIITSIGYDHQAVLGNSISKISAEKCGIIKDGCPVVSYPLQKKSAADVISNCAISHKSCLIIPNAADAEILDMSLCGSSFKYKGDEYTISLAGKHQVYNAITAIEALKVVSRSGYEITKQNISDALRKIYFPARMEIISKNPLVVVDGAHNMAGAEMLKQNILLLFKKPPIMVVGMLGDKNYKDVIKYLLPYATGVITTTTNNSRAVCAEDLAVISKLYSDNVVAIEDNLQALNTAVSMCDNDECGVIVFGSLYLASDIINIMKSGMQIKDVMQ